MVAVNSDSSVRRLKGPGRAVQTQGDRAAIVEALEMVDAALVCEEDTPVQVLEWLRPGVFVKGGDYAGVDMAELAGIAGLGGPVVTVPTLDGYSTTGLVQASRAS